MTAFKRTSSALVKILLSQPSLLLSVPSFIKLTIPNRHVLWVGLKKLKGWRFWLKMHKMHSCSRSVSVFTVKILNKY